MGGAWPSGRGGRRRHQNRLQRQTKGSTVRAASILMRLIFAITVLSLLTGQIVVAAEQAGYEELQRKAKLAYVSGKRDEAITLITQAIALEQKNPLRYFIRTRFH